MSEFIRVSKVSSEIEGWKFVREILDLNDGDTLIKDVSPVGGSENEFDVEITDGARAMVVGLLGRLSSLSMVPTSHP